MRGEKKYLVLGFATTTDAMAAEAFCAEHGIGGRLIPLPPAVDAGCGLAWRMLPEEYPPLEALRGSWTFKVQKSAEITMQTAVYHMKKQI